MRKPLAIAMVMASTLAWTGGCRGQAQATQPAEHAAMSYRLQGESADFDFGLFRQGASEDFNTSIALSPLSSKLALAMAYSGASGGNQGSHGRGPGPRGHDA